MNTLGNILLTLGFFGILGSAGASDLNDISLQQAFLQVVCSIYYRFRINDKKQSR